MQRSWPGQGVRRCFSLGWGLSPVGQTECLVLAEAVIDEVAGSTPTGAELVQRLSAAGFVVQAREELVHGGHVLRLAAYPEPRPAGHP
ncbi:hypothetical protein [uncultured Cellulomonas sp.]|uniref:hypothetical protein n=1 Tax=uncultured Cellulomonas sp. TaxID=189682 RepID=UPI0028E50BA1|nr:hypothetical protein [uncultured Cellulomonas sp.]